jgi:dedicator of cytokinesis protein 3
LEGKFNGEDQISKKGKIFLNDMKQLLSHLLKLKKYSDNDLYEDEKIIAIMELMDYLKATNRRKSYIKYVHLLCDEHISNCNFSEAGLSILLHADLLNWSDEILEEEGDFPSQSSSQRKETILKLSINYLDKGKLWEKAIDLIKELKYQYEFVYYDYQKLSFILQKEANLFRSINDTERFFSMYFRVGFYGKGFDDSLSGFQFIYRGFELERISDFISRIKSKYPQAQLLNFTEPPPLDIINSENQYLQIFLVKSSSMDELEGKERKFSKKMPVSMQKYQRENNVNVFLYSRPFKKTKSSNEFRDLWICNYYYITEDSFPTIHRRSKILKQNEIILSPIDNAVNTIQEKNKELLEIIGKHESMKDNVSPFTMVLKGVIDAAVNGGVKMYKDAFFNQDYFQQNPDKKDAMEKLKESFDDQLEILEKGLGIHSKICPDDMRELQEQLEVQFAAFRIDMTSL